VLLGDKRGEMHLELLAALATILAMSNGALKAAKKAGIYQG
jgi:hypothetical protein